MANSKLERLREKREEFRDHIRSLWKSGKSFSENDQLINEKLNAIHADILKKEMADPNIKKVRTGYSICGYSEKHGYFRNKRFISEDLMESEFEFKEAKKDSEWRIPTLLIKETFLRKESPAMTDFDKEDINHLVSSDHQEIIQKHMCGNKQYRWKDLINGYSRFTY